MKKKIVIVGVILLVMLVLAVVLRQAPEPEIESIVEVEKTDPQYQVIGTSIEGRKIESYKFGNGTTTLMFVGGIHGGYEWNSVLLAYQLVDYFTANPSAVPKDLTINIIPSLNPDGLYRVTGKDGRFAIADVATDQATLEAGRFNANNVDLNRNFDCKWQPISTWRSATVNAGTSAFSESETIAFRDFIKTEQPDAVVFWHSQANTVYGSACEGGVLPATTAIMNAYARAAGYGAVEFFDAYPITGDAGDWLASINIPSIAVELKTHETVEFNQNLAGVKALIEYYNR